ncbi:MAG: hypothetical protein BGP06_21250 [Rhizobiales bacterium 65-9]|nr:hypothetical protein [Hyphomicrobiales bacterium]OJY36535.1 MAG: hypothetical protein BGP06_21250 [Rhizobiales bacterium 65-9]
MRIARRIPFLAFSIILYYVLVSLSGIPLDRTLFSVPLPSGAGLSVTLAELLILIAIILGFFELLGSTSATTVAIISHGLQMIVFLVALLLFLLLPVFGTATFLIITMMTLINTIAGYSVSIMRARRDFSFERDMS